jgi:hypothetical protein
MNRGLRVVLALALAVTMSSTMPTAAASAADNTPTQLLAATVTPLGGRVDTGFLAMRLDLELSDPEGLPGSLRVNSQGYYTFARATSTGSGTVDYSRVGAIGWTWLGQVSGTPTHGVWSRTVEVTRAFTGGYSLTVVGEIEDLDGSTTDVTLDPQPTFDILAADVWDINPGPAIRIVTGSETWQPSFTVTDRNTALPVSAWVRVENLWTSDLERVEELVRTPEAPGTRLPANGAWVGPARTVRKAVLEEFLSLGVWGSRGSRGWSLEAKRRLCPAAKIQASSRYSAVTLPRSGTLTVSGHGFPAPVVYPVYGWSSMPVHLQRLTGSTWQTVAISYVRRNGRYDVTWQPDTTGVHQLRIRVPGTTNECGTHVGTSLATVPVTVTS